MKKYSIPIVAGILHEFAVVWRLTADIARYLHLTRERDTTPISVAPQCDVAVWVGARCVFFN